MQASTQIVVDTVAPASPTIAVVAGDDRVNASEQSASMSGSAEPGASVALSIGGFTRLVSADAQGRWYFQNGPQRVYVELESTPLIWRIERDGRISAHTGRASEVQACLMDEAGHLYLHTALGLGLVHTQDVGLAAELIEQGRWTLGECRSERLAERYGYVPSPQQQALR